MPDEDQLIAPPVEPTRPKLKTDAELIMARLAVMPTREDLLLGEASIVSAKIGQTRRGTAHRHMRPVFAAVLALMACAAVWAVVHTFVVSVVMWN
jgi:hypothetical protein